MIGVSVRVRPFLRNENYMMKNGDRSCLSLVNGVIQSFRLDIKGFKPYKIPQCFWSHSGFITQGGKHVGQSQIYSSQEDVYRGLQIDFGSLRDGRQLTVITTGQCAGGKSYTMFGDPQNRGIFYQLSTDLFNQLQGGELHVQFYQICRDDVLDLLNNQTRARIISKGDNFSPENLTTKKVDSLEDLFQLITCKRGRQVHTMCSERFVDHTFVNLLIHRNGERIGSVLFADLMSEERLSHIGASKEQIEFIKYQNQSVADFKHLLVELSKKKDPEARKVLFRQNSLTMLLKQAFVGQNLTHIIFCIGAAEYEYGLIDSNLQLAECAAKINPLNPPLLNKPIQEQKIALNDAEVQLIQSV